ncbi:MAG: replicative DNA helicase [Elusimicrobia bacterium RIFCSPLOWO2_01_FULL_54_10]|nr:MAG: replicative DNA helicase [Elusimicrobia bacterium RIFCSPLOWO2_01_FULL_54_10]
MDLKVPPYSEDAERAVLGCMLIDKESLETAVESLTDQNFYCGPNGKIFSIMKDMVLASKVVDVITLSDELSKRELLDTIGGADYLTQAINAVPTAAHINDYIRIVKEKDILRNLINAASKVVGDCYKTTDDPDRLLDEAERLIYSIADQKRSSTMTPLSDMLHGMIDHLEALHRREQMVTGVPTGFKKFDELTSGLQPGNLIILAARPGVGKTALALNIALHCSIARKLPVVIFSLEMSQQEIGMRLFSSVTNIPLGKLRTGFFKKSDWPMITRKAEVLSDSPIHLDTSSELTVFNIRSATRRLARRLKAKGTPLALVIIDYLQLMSGSRKSPESRQTEIAEISRSLKGLARDLNVPVLALSQLNRSPEERGREGRPQLSHLRESGAIEQDADLVAFIYREGMYKTDRTPEDMRRAKLIIAKQRNGPQGDIDLTFVDECARFENFESEEV